MDEQKPEQEPEATPPQPPTQAVKPPVQPDPPVSGPLASLEAWLYDTLVVKAPYQLPKAFTDWVVQFSPWITLVLGLLMLSVILSVFAISNTNVGAVYGALVASVAGPMYYVAIVMLVVQVVVMFVSIPMLLKQQRKGWLLLFYADIVSLVYSILNSLAYGSLNLGGLIMGLLGTALGLYFIFQIRSYYKH